jgi:hypothetical protein
LKIASCSHREHISNVESGIDEGVRGACDQVRRYEWREGKGGKTKRVTKVTKLGRVNGKLVPPSPKDIIGLAPSEVAELNAAIKEAEETTANPNDSQEKNDGEPVPSLPKTRRCPAEFEDNKEAILHDYQILTLRDFYKKWTLNAARGTSLKKTWGVIGKRSRPSRKSARVPAALTSEQKGAIVKDAAVRGFKVVASEHSLDWKVVRSWVLTYCRKPEKQKRNSEQSPNASVIITTTTNGLLPPFPAFNDSWPFLVQEKWLEVHLEMRKLGGGRA